MHPARTGNASQHRPQLVSGKEGTRFSATTPLDRRDWELKSSHALETCGVLVAETVRIDAEAQFVRQD